MTKRTRPFVSARQTSEPARTVTKLAPSRPFSFAGARTNTTAAMTTASSVVNSRGSVPTPRWTVAVYAPGLEHVAPSNPAAQSGEHTRPSWMTPSTDSVVEASLALADDVVEAGRHATSREAAEVLEVVARRLRSGEILLPPGASTKTEAAVVSSVLSALLGGRR